MTLKVILVKPLSEGIHTGTPTSILKCNDVEFIFPFKSYNIKYNDIKTVEEIINLIYISLMGFNYNRFRILNKKYKNIVINLCQHVLKKEFEIFLEKSYYDLVDTDEVLTVKSIMDKLGVTRTTIEKTTISKMARSTYLKLSKMEFEEALKNKEIEKVAKLYKRILGNKKFNFIKECDETLIHDYLMYIGKILIDLKIEPSSRNIILYTIFLDVNNKKFSFETTILYVRFKKQFIDVSLKSYTIYSEKVVCNLDYKFEEDEWVIFQFNKAKILQKMTFKFENFTKNQKIEVKLYIDFLVNNEKNRRDAQKRLNSLKSFYKELNKLNYNKINSILEIKYVPHVQHLVDHFLLLKADDGTPKYNLLTITRIFYNVSDFFQWSNNNSNNNLVNPFLNVKWKNQRKYINKTAYIPEHIIEEINKHIHELETPYQNVWHILMNGGMRISECVNLEADWLYFDTQLQCYILKYIPYKIENNRRKKGESIFQTIPVNEKLINAFKSQEKLTREIRKAGNGTKKIFISTKNYIQGFIVVSGSSVANNINKLCVKYNIKDDNNEFYHYNNHQCRKTVIVELLDNNAQLEIIAKFIGHDDINTTRNIYAEIKEKKILELETNYFDEVFNYLHKEKFEQLPKKDVEGILNEIKEGARLAPEGQGYCGKHVIYGPCIKNRCIGCNHFITTPKQIPIFKEMINEQQTTINLLEKYFLEIGVSDKEFTNYKSYNFEINLLNILEDSLNELIEFVKEKIPIEKQSEYI